MLFLRQLRIAFAERRPSGFEGVARRLEAGEFLARELLARARVLPVRPERITALADATARHEEAVYA